MIKNTFTLILIFLFAISFAQESAIADLKFEEAEMAFNNQEYKTTIKKLDEFDKLLGSIKDKSLYLRIISQDKLFKPDELYDNESNFNLLSSLRKNTSAYLIAMESSGLDERYREVYAINEKLANYPIEKTVWIKEKQKSDLEKQEAEKKNKELVDFYRELTPKIEAWEWDEKIKIGADFKNLKKQYPDFYKEFNENPKKNDLVNGNKIIRINKKNDVSRIQSEKEIDRIITEFGNIVSYSLDLNESYALKIMNMWKQEFGENAINEYLHEKNRPNYKIGMYVLESPKTREKIYIEYILVNNTIKYRGIKLITGLDNQKFYENLKKVN
ncbi:hypothetical protein [Flavobacterium sp. UBA6195]|uniref:hypothetical protein n=1 Tax=Flavobacterium sp. UBA6195 TaxID=1946554 RepID=UPI0025B7F433|nr:hypothetical protein [Flavobacterium sp. UBA6195]